DRPVGLGPDVADIEHHAESAGNPPEPAHRLFHEADAEPPADRVENQTGEKFKAGADEAAETFRDAGDCRGQPASSAYIDVGRVGRDPPYALKLPAQRQPLRRHGFPDDRIVDPADDGAAIR